MLERFTLQSMNRTKGHKNSKKKLSIYDFVTTFMLIIVCESFIITTMKVSTNSLNAIVRTQNNPFVCYQLIKFGQLPVQN